MPHLVIEITQNIAVDQHALLAKTNKALLQSGQFNEPDVKARCVVLQTYRQGTEERHDGFVHATLSILSGRSESVRQALAQTVCNVIAESLPPRQNFGVQVSVEVRELLRETYAKVVLPA